LYCVGCEETYTNTEAIKHDDGQYYCRVGHKLINKSEPSYFFRMNKYNEWIKEYLNEHPHFIYPEARKNEMFKSFLEDGVEDLSVSRTSVK
jgi:methionyl-tRNA synthetase